MGYFINYIGAGDWGRRARGPDWEGDTLENFYYLFRRDNFTMSYATYMSVAEKYRAELDALPNVTVTGIPSVAAKGEIVGLDAPESVQQGASFDIAAMTKNTGEGSGTFKMRLLINGVLKATSPNFTLAAGATSSDKIPAATAPTTGTSMTFTVECIRIT